MRILIETFGDTQLDRELLRFNERAVNPIPAFEMIMEEVAKLNTEQFDSQGERSSGGWAPLADSTVLYKAANDLDPRILHATLALRDSLTDRTDSAHEEVVSPEGFMFGSDVGYGEYHQHGTKNMPMRKPVELTVADREAFVKTLQRYVVEGVTVG